MTYFEYERPQRKSAAVCLLNVAVASVMLGLAHYYLPIDSQKEASESFLFYANIGYSVSVTILLGIATYFYINNKAIKIWVNSDELGIVDPTFGDYELIVNVQDIIEFSQTKSAGSGNFNTGLMLKGGSYKSLVFNNYKLDKKAFFTALKQATPAIVLPESIYAHKITRPEWAKKVRSKLNLKD